MALKTGDDAPDFELRSHRGGTVKLSGFRGRKNVLLAFHPLAFTPVCATQMRGYEQDVSSFASADTVVLGISIDPQPSKAAWAKELRVTWFDLLSDNHPYGEVAKKYGVFREKEGFSERCVFLVDKSGKVAWSRVYDIPEHPANQEVFQVLETLGEVEGRSVSGVEIVVSAPDEPGRGR